MEEIRKFRKLPNGKLEVVINTTGDVMIPDEENPGKQRSIGAFRQIATQEITEPDILMKLLVAEKEKGETHLIRCNEILSKLSGLNTSMLPTDVALKLEKHKDKATKKFREQFPMIEKFLQERNQKITNETNKTFIEAQVKKINEQIEKLEKAI